MQATKSLELRIPGQAMQDEAFVELAERMGCAGTSSETDADSGAETLLAWFEASDDEAGQKAGIAAAFLLAGVRADHIHLAMLDAADWATAWQKDWKAMPVGKQLWVRPSFCEAAPAGRIDIVLDPGMAFGTGQHATTRLCLEAIERICSKLPPATMLDMGAGSGILAIAAAKLGAGEVVAIDNDPISVEACSVNAGINGVSLASQLGDTPPSAVYDLVVANILAGPLIHMAPQLSRCVAKTLVLSGLLTTQVQDVAAAYIAAGLKLQRADSQEEWAAIEFGW